MSSTAASGDATAISQPEDGKTPSQDASGECSEVATTTHDASGEDSDIEEIECVGVVTRESNMLTDVLMEFFCNLLENNEVSFIFLELLG